MMGTRDVAVWCLLGLTFIGVCLGQVTVELEISSATAPPGEEVTILCRIRGTQSPTYIYYWQKEVIDEAGESHLERIATNDIFDPPYTKHVDRYKSSLTELGDTHMAMLTILNLNEQDSGHYKCIVPRGDNAEDTVRLEVYKQPESIGFVGAENGAMMTFRENEELPVTCDIGAALPIPTVTVFVGSMDYTETFRIEPHLDIRCTGNIGSKDCLLHMVYTSTAVNEALKVTSDMDGQKIKCTASVLPSDADLPPVSAEVTMAVLYAPKFIECARIIEINEGASNFELICDVQSNPVEADVKWSFKLPHGVVEVPPGGSTEDGAYSALAQDVGPKRRSYTLRIAKVALRDFGIDFVLSVNNTQGYAEHTINLKELLPEQPIAGASSLQLTSFLLITTAAILTLFY